jgi:hypothetical protein
MSMPGQENIDMTIDKGPLHNPAIVMHFIIKRREIVIDGRQLLLTTEVRRVTAE